MERQWSGRCMEVSRRGDGKRTLESGTSVLYGVGGRKRMSHLRLPRLKPGGSDPLPLRCFRLRDHRVTVRVAPGPSQAARPLAERGPSLLQWHRCWYHSGQPCGWEQVCVRGLASQCPTEWCISVACSTQSTGPFVLVPVGPIDHATPTHDAVGKVLQSHARTSEHTRQ
jgi:hypothetical protein